MSSTQRKLKEFLGIQEWLLAERYYVGLTDAYDMCVAEYHIDAVSGTVYGEFAWPIQGSGVHDFINDLYAR